MRNTFTAIKLVPVTPSLILQKSNADSLDRGSMFIKSALPGGSEMVQGVKAFIARSDTLSSIPSACTVEGGTQLPHVVL